MDHTWRAKNSSTWTLPMPEILPSSLLPTIIPAMSTPSSCSANQMNMIHRQCIFPFASQVYNGENHATLQEQPIFPTLQLGVTDLRKNDMNNYFLATTPHNLIAGTSPLVKLHGHNNDTIVSNNYYTPPITSIYPLNKSTNGSILNPRVHSLDESKPSLLSKSFKSTNLLNDLQFSPPIDRVVNNNQFQNFHREMNKIRISQNLSAKTTTVVPSHESIHSRGCPRVFCMTTVGDLFLNELGLLGVTCHCHNMAMSVTKFCEHAGSSANVPHAVHLESGMTIGQWRKLCFGTTAPDDSKGWDWPDDSSTENFSVKPGVPLPLHPHPVGYVKIFSGLANSLEEEYQMNHLVNAGYGSKGSYGIQSPFYSHPNSKSSISRNNSPSEEHKISVNEHASNIDLRLGQPPQVHISVAFPTAMRPMQHKPQANHPPKEKFLTGQNELGKHAMLTEDNSICPKVQESSTCHACYVSDHPCLRLGKQIFDQKEQCHKKPFYGNHCTVLAKHLASCCLNKNFSSTSNSINSQSLRGSAKIGQFSRTCNEVHNFHDAKCENKKQNFMSGQPGLWRDVPAKITDASTSKSSIGKGDKTAHDFDTKIEEQMSNIYTGSPAPALTEVSVEINGETFCSHYSDNRRSYEFVVDEESVVEKCGSSDEAASDCEKTNAVIVNQDDNMESKDEEQMETGSHTMNSGSSHYADSENLKLILHDEHASQIQAHNAKHLSGFKRKEISSSLTECFETNDNIQQVMDEDQLLRTLAVPSEKNKQVHVKESNHSDFGKPYKYISLNYIAKDGTNIKEIDKEVVDTKVKPVICGKYGGLKGQKKPTKIVSLSSLLKRTKKCNTNEYGLLCRKSVSSKTRKMLLRENNEDNSASPPNLKNDSVTQNGTTCGINSNENSTHRECKEYQTKPRYKVVRSCSLSRLLAEDHHTTITNVSIDVKDSGKIHLNNEVHDGEPIQIGTERYSKVDFNASCCVCGKANKEESIVMLECHRCLIKVHQTCYGVSEVPFGNWLCRPCKISSQSTGLPQSQIVKNPKPKCARTEGFNGLKSENHIFSKNAYDRGECVSQEQINAWAHINSLTSCKKTTVKLSSSDTDRDMRPDNDHWCSRNFDTNSTRLNQTQKEYVRYKQSKAWKNLVVYKSGIHSFGLYSSQFINRGTMVVEYVGEIIGQKVADKREKEYEMGNRLQYKSACYFFKIDKDNILDATRKGGIARFVNHSCQPNCVAKIITVWTAKKVVFFATRDINPGEEITYDYHFNSEDEGEKIPCYCNSKNCRRYLN